MCGVSFVVLGLFGVECLAFGWVLGWWKMLLFFNVGVYCRVLI